MSRLISSKQIFVSLGDDMDLPEKITIWNRYENNDGAGTITYDRPVVVDARIAYVESKITDKNGNSYMSKSVVYTDSGLISQNSVVYLGESDEIKPVNDANDVRKLTSTPSGTSLKKAWL